MPHLGELQVLPTTEGWIPAVYLNSWVDFGTTTASAAYFKDSHSVVHLRGLVKSGVINSPIFSLPAGFRPPKDALFGIVSGGVFGVLAVGSNGDVTCSVGSNTWVSLEGITIRTI